MIARRIVFFVFLLGVWGQATSACPEAHVASVAAHAAMEITVFPPEDFTAAGGEQRCECPAAIRSAQALVSETDKSLLTSLAQGTDAFLNSSNPNSVTLSERSRASGLIARPSGRPPYLLLPRLRQ